MNTTIQEPLTIDVVADVVCPWCYIGKRHLEQALKEFPDDDVRVAWRPYELNPGVPEEGYDRKAYMIAKFGGIDGAKNAYNPIRESFEQLGIDADFSKIERVPNTKKAHRLIYWAQGQKKQAEVMEELFKAYFVRGEDVGDVDVLGQVAEAVGMDGDLTRELLVTDKDAGKIEQMMMIAQNMGVAGVPFYIMAQKFPLTGAQPPEVIANTIRMALQEPAGTA